MPRPVLQIPKEQVSCCHPQSIKSALTDDDIERILAERRCPPIEAKEYKKVKGFKEHDPSEYTVGTIILTGPMYKKTRPAIVVAKLSESILVVPLLTYDGNGLKHYHAKSNYMSICDQREGGWYKVQNDMPVLLTEDDKGMYGELILPESIVEFTAPFDILYSRATLIRGRLCERSTQVLLECFQKDSARKPQLVRGPIPKPNARTGGSRRPRQRTPDRGYGNNSSGSTSMSVFRWPREWHLRSATHRAKEYQSTGQG